MILSIREIVGFRRLCRRRYVRSILKHAREECYAMDKFDRGTVSQAWENLYEAISKDENRFETKITLISAGAITLSMTFISGFDGIPCRMWLFYFAIFCLVFALLTNMLFYLIGKTWKRNYIRRYERYLRRGKWSRRKVNNELTRLSMKIDTWNWVSLLAMSIGVITLLVFVFINL